MGTFVLVNLIIGVMVPNISIAGHAGGFVTGFAAGWALDRDPARAPRLDFRRIARGALLVLVLAGASVLVAQRVRGDPRTWSALPLMRAEEAYKADQWKAVDEHTTDALAFEPHSEVALEWRAVARAELGRKQEALADCNALLAIDPGTPNVRGLYVRAELQMGFGDFAAARADFDELVKLEPDAGKYRARLGVALLGSGEWAAAERQLEGAQRATEPADTDIELWIARQMTGQRENADEELRKYEFSARGTRASEKTKFLLSVALGKEGELRGATSDELAQRVGVLRALRRVQTGSFDEARREAQRVIDDRPYSWEASVARAIVAQLKR
jgi:tetratricopeptide (TPR) repeat protein